MDWSKIRHQNLKSLAPHSYLSYIHNWFTLSNRFDSSPCICAVSLSTIDKVDCDPIQFKFCVGNICLLTQPVPCVIPFPSHTRVAPMNLAYLIYSASTQIYSRINFLRSAHFSELVLSNRFPLNSQLRRHRKLTSSAIFTDKLSRWTSS